jgi:hypothetical protein
MTTTRIIGRRHALTAAIVIGAAALALFAAVGPASATEPNTHASCMGQEAGSISPPGSSEEVPGGMPELMEFFLSLPATPGNTVSFVAGLHEGSHEACDEVLEG